MRLPFNTTQDFTLKCVVAISVLLVGFTTFYINPALGLFISLGILLISLTRFELTKLTIAFIVVHSIVHFFKRMLFLFGPQPRSIYYGIQFIPTILLGITLLVALLHLYQRKIPLSGKLLLAFLGFALVNTIISPYNMPLMSRASALHQQIVPFLMFFLGLALPFRAIIPVGRTLALLIVISVLYGLLLFHGGPTIIEQTWATETSSYSIQSFKVWAFMHGGMGIESVFRIFSIYSDPFRWGFFLLACIIANRIALQIKAVSATQWYFLLAFTLFGMFMTMSRSPWLVLILTLLLFFVLKWSCFRRASVMILLLGVSFALMIIVVRYALQHLVKHFFSNPFLIRYSTVGTMIARVNSWQYFKEVILSHLFMGGGVGYGSAYMELFTGDERMDSMWAHNAMVDLVYYVGLPGFLLFISFIYQWLKECFQTISRTSEEPIRRVFRVIVAFSVSSVIVSLISGLQVYTFFLFLLMGFATGYTATSSNKQKDLSGIQ